MNVRDRLQRRMWLALLAGAIIALLPAWLIYTTYSRIEHDEDAIDQSVATVRSLGDVFISIQEIQGGARGYALTGDRAFLQPYEYSLSDVDGHLRQLAELTATDPARVAQVETLAALTGSRVAFSRATIEMRDRQGPGSEELAGLLREAEDLTAHIRLLVGNMRERESALLSEREAASDRATRQALLTSTGFALAAAVLLVGIVFVAGRALETRRRAVEAGSRIAAIVQASSDAIMSLDTGGIITSWNAGAEAIFGYTAAEAVGQHITLIAAPGEEAAVRANVALLLEGRPIMGQVNRRRAKDGRPVDISLSASPIRGASGEIAGISAILRDITERRRVEAALRRSERQLAEVFRTSPIGMCITRAADGTIIDINETLLAQVGYAREEAVGTTMEALGLWPQADRLAEVEARLASEGSVRNLELRCQGRSGRPLEVVTSWTRIILGGEVCTIILVDDRTAERTVTRDIERLFTLSSDLISVASFDGYLRRINPAASATLGYSEEEVRTIRFLDIVHPEDRAQAAATFGRLRDGDSTVNTWEGRIRCKDGSYRWIELVGSPDYDQQLFYTVGRDTSHRRKIEAELHAAHAAAEEANRAKSQFLSRMSHELRTPLNVVLGFGQVLQLDPLEPEQAEAVEHILTAGRHLLSLIDEVLDISRIEAGRISLSIEPIHAGEAVSEAASLLRAAAEERGVELQVDLSSCGGVILADRQRLKQVVMNLLSNGIKYNHRGGSVWVTCAPAPDDHLRLLVRDTGLGIAPEKLGRLFTPFDRLGAEATGVEGTGLGLSLSKHLVDAMKGSMGVESAPGEGSTFWVDIPLAEPGVEPAERGLAVGVPPAASRGGRTILYIEDNLANLKLMERVLMSRLGNRLVAAMQGSLGVQLARDQHPDLVLLDLHLPDMMGTDVLRELQVDPATRDIPVVIVSADATPAQIARLLDGGARAYLTKPIDITELITITESLLQEGA